MTDVFVSSKVLSTTEEGEKGILSEVKGYLEDTLRFLLWRRNECLQEVSAKSHQSDSFLFRVNFMFFTYTVVLGEEKLQVFNELQRYIWEHVLDNSCISKYILISAVLRSTYLFRFSRYLLTYRYHIKWYTHTHLYIKYRVNTYTLKRYSNEKNKFE